MKPKKLFYTVAVIFTALLAQSCLNNDSNDLDDIYYPNGIVTIKTNADNVVYLQLNDKTTLLPINIKKHPYEGKEVRALLNFKEVEEEHDGFSKAVHVNWIDSILTKPITPYIEEDEDKYGHDPIDITNRITPIVEDGYLTLNVSTRFSNSGKKHMLTLLSGKNPDDPYEVELKHNAFGDSHGMLIDSFVAFKLNSLPDTEGKTVDMKIVWKSYEGDTRNLIVKYKSKEE